MILGPIGHRKTVFRHHSPEAATGEGSRLQVTGTEGGPGVAVRFSMRNPLGALFTLQPDRRSWRRSAETSSGGGAPAGGRVSAAFRQGLLEPHGRLPQSRAVLCQALEHSSFVGCRALTGHETRTLHALEGRRKGPGFQMQGREKSDRQQPPP